MVLRIGFSLLVVLGLMWALAKVARRPMAGRGGAALAVLARQQLSRSASVAVVRVVDRALVVGVSEGQVTLLAETDLAGFERAPAETTTRETIDPTLPAQRVAPEVPASRLAGSALSPATWRQTMDFLRERTVRR
jgi:flagellar protein FliO/FliZ